MIYQNIYSFVLVAAAIMGAKSSPIDEVWFGRDEPIRHCMDGDYIYGKGFDAYVFEYPLGSNVGLEENFFSEGYKKLNYLSTTTYVEKSDMHHYQNEEEEDRNIYGIPISPSNFTLVLSGFFKPEKNGNYVITLNADDGAVLSFGAINSGCTAFTPNCVDHSNALRSIKHDPDFSGQNEKIFRDLKAGKYYPIEIIYFNKMGAALLEAEVKAPDGNVSQLSENVYPLHFK